MTVTADPREGTAGTTRSSSRSRSNTMSFTYSDFLYTRNDYSESYGDESREERRSLPSDCRPILETKVPLMQNADPATQDFIIVAEFSELEGPIPLCTIPNDAPEKSDIRINDFVVHLMSTDYQVNTVGQFRICQDTQVMRKNVFPGAHVFMQYFTLYDLKARGFVRPFCFGYVSKDHVKLDKCLSFLMIEFGKITSQLERCNREWFAQELKLYLKRLEEAKDSYIEEHSSLDNDNQSDEFLDSEAITLTQIAHQYTEIQNILRIVQSSHDKSDKRGSKDFNDMASSIERHLDSRLELVMRKIGVIVNSTTTCDRTPDLSASQQLVNIPLVHPLRMKGEPLRSVTSLGQLGCVYMLGKLMQIYSSCKTDIIFTEMSESTVSFRQHCRNLGITFSSGANCDTATSSPGKSSGISSTDLDHSVSSGSAADCSFSEESKSSVEQSPFELFQEKGSRGCLWYLIRTSEFGELIDKLHSSNPLVPDNKSGSYHTVSEEESDINMVETGAEGEDKVTFRIPEVRTTNPVEARKYDCDHNTSTSDICEDMTGLKLSSMHSFSSDEDMSLSSASSSLDTSEEQILKESWWIYASKKLVRGVPGYGLSNFFRRYHDAAHHVLYSILLGRPLIICGEEKLSRKVSRIITALIPLVPVVAASTSKNNHWKLLRWHRGILVQAHIEAYRLIGLCIPEKLEVYDLIPPRLVTHVTIFSVDKRCILGGPAYSGNLLQNFEKKLHMHFYNSDVSLLSYMGTIFTEIESKVFMYKSVADKYKGKGAQGSLHLFFKQLNVRNSDVEIVKYLASILPDPSECVTIF